jgi:hypothetical protein
LVQAAALALGVALYSVDWAAVWQRLRPARGPRPRRSDKRGSLPKARLQQSRVPRRSHIAHSVVRAS